jgi:glucan phosphorylase
LRLVQEYFLVACAVRDIVRTTAGITQTLRDCPSGWRSSSMIRILP